MTSHPWWCKWLRSRKIVKVIKNQDASHCLNPVNNKCYIFSSIFSCLPELHSYKSVALHKIYDENKNLIKRSFMYKFKKINQGIGFRFNYA